MDRRDCYLFNAGELLELAKNEHYAEFKAGFESLALVYLRLAEQADRNTRINIPYEKPPKKDGDQA